jgi:DNA-binding NtrC family response regulator
MESEKKILLVDDEREFLDIMAKFLTRRKIGFETACGCVEALDWVNRGLFDVVLMDVSMPGISGLECMTELQKMQDDLEIILLTGNASINTGIIGMEKGAFDYCLKPVEFDELLEKITLAKERYAGRRRLASMHHDQ